MTIGRSLAAAIAVTTASVKPPGLAAPIPMSTVGRSSSTALTRSVQYGASCANGTVWWPNSSERDAHTRPAASTKKQRCIAASAPSLKRRCSGTQRGQQRGERGGCGALDIVGEAAVCAAVGLQQAERVRAAKVLKLDDTVWVGVVNRVHELGHKAVVLCARRARLLHARVFGAGKALGGKRHSSRVEGHSSRVEGHANKFGVQRSAAQPTLAHTRTYTTPAALHPQPHLVVGPDVQHNRQAFCRVDARRGGVQLHLCLRGAQPIGAEVAQPEHLLAVRHDDEAHVARRQRVGNLSRVRVHAQVQAAWLQAKAVEAEACVAECGHVQDGEQLLWMGHERSAEGRRGAWRQGRMENGGVQRVRSEGRGSGRGGGSGAWRQGRMGFRV
eukprot:328746-Chlamydomonas_euryale.AAC.1